MSIPSSENSNSTFSKNIFIKRLKQQPIDVPFNSKQKFVWKLLRTRLEYLAQENNLNKEVIKLPTAEPTDLNWKNPKAIFNRALQEFLFTKEKRNNTTR